MPNAQIGIAGNKPGTSTSVEGRFALRVPAAYAGTKLVVALPGYRRYAQALPRCRAPRCALRSRAVRPGGARWPLRRRPKDSLGVPLEVVGELSA